MDWETLEAALCDCPLVPVLNVARPEDAAPLASALVAGGVTVCEVTLRTEAGLSAISAFKSECPGLITGGGSVLDSRAMHDVVSAGADFVVSPGLDDELLETFATCPVPVLPGVATASEAMVAYKAGLRHVKLFPASVIGGPELIKALAAPLPDMAFMPTGGVTLANISSFLTQPNVFSVGGTWIAKPELMERGDWAAITQRAKEARNAARSLRP
ncbi:MAG: bifunctional 4-hydroxy-2-oxoglutarate aldolase/2-dehydro-3-deoxy-phosphogluconate aldolase [Pseudomonadota bacterium]